MTTTTTSTLNNNNNNNGKLLDQPVLTLAVDNLAKLHQIDEKQLSAIWNCKYQSIVLAIKESPGK
jgi:hypothetical protein